MVEKGITEERLDSLKRAAKKKKCVKKIARDICLRRLITQSLSDTVGIRKRAAREKLFSLLGYDLIEKTLRAQDVIELPEKLRSQMDDGPERPGGVSDDDWLCVSRVKGIEEIAYFG